IDASVTATWNDEETTGTDVLEGFKPIGTYTAPDVTSFRGVFDGNGKKIIGLTINRPGQDNIGLFGKIGAEGKVKNLTIEGGMITGFIVGGLAGRNYGTVETCVATSTITGTGPSMGMSQSVGGLVGINYKVVENCTARGSVTGRGTYLSVGGMAGINYSSIENCIAAGPVTGAGTSLEIGGLVGRNERKIANSFATGTVTGETTTAYSSADTGGLVGFNNYKGTIQNCFATGSVTGKSVERVRPMHSVGGLIGSNNIGAVVNSFAVGTVTGTGSSVRGLIGDNNTDDQVKNCYWDKESTGQTAVAGYMGAVSKTTAEMKRQATFQPGGGTGENDWNFETVWGIAEGQSYPYLRFAPAPFYLDISTQGGGMVTLNPPGGFYAPGTTVTLTAMADTEFHLAEWTGVATSSSNQSTCVVMNTHKSVTARFSRSYEIRTLAELQALATGDLEGYYTLMNDIDASDTANWNDAGTDTGSREGFRPIGSYSDSDTTSFRGIF
ncbi:MAG TPA: GLUG motif-containing protein, partial [Candidatus Sumerlaeota bacterium]|nr:GLUG motif-containing protein [Candidatus Sumerlaeota bacterium]